MLLTQKEILTILYEILPDLPEQKKLQIAEGILQRQRKWKEVKISEMGAGISVQCKDICVLGNAIDKGCSIRAFFADKD